jgi:hypothetical protein
MKPDARFMNAHALHFRRVYAHLTRPISEAELANAQSALEEAIRNVEQDVAIETAVGRMEQDLMATDMRQIVRDDDLSQADPSFMSKVKQFIRRLRSRE